MAKADGSSRSTKRRGELIIASNRLPVSVRVDDGDGYVAEPAAGGLVAALGPVIRERGGAWVGWAGVSDATSDAVRPAIAKATGLDVIPVELTDDERDAFYLGFSNEIVWPLFHDLQTSCNFDPAYWDVYEGVNLKFARAIAKRSSSPDDLVWVHDYHLMRVGKRLRELGHEGRIGYFIHIPFPGPDIFRKLPWRRPIIEGLLEYDLLGFQTRRDVQNFLASARSILPLESLPPISADIGEHRLPGSRRRTRVGDFPIGIDWEREVGEAESEEARAAEAEVRSDVGSRRLLLGVDRLDYTKGLPERLDAFREALVRYPELRGGTTLLQLVVPSRQAIPEYAALREEIERRVGSINGELGAPGWVPVIYLHTTVDRVQLRGWYRAADVGLVTPLKDGMNLVAKEYCAACVDERGVLVLSEFAGSAQQLGEGALLVNPHDRLELAAAIARACQMPVDEQRERMRDMRRIVEATDVHWWADSFLDALVAPRSAAPSATSRATGTPSRC